MRLFDIRSLAAATLLALPSLAAVPATASTTTLTFDESGSAPFFFQDQIPLSTQYAP